MAHPYHMHREQQVAHRRVGPMLKGEPAGATKLATGKAFSNVTSKTAAQGHDDIAGQSMPGRFARGGKVKSKGHQTNIAIVLPSGAQSPPGAGPTAGPGPVPGPAPSPMGMKPPGAPGMPPAMPPGMPMHKRGGRVKKADGGPVDSMPVMPDRSGDKMSADTSSNRPDFLRGKVAKAKGGSIAGEATKADIKSWSKRAKDNDYFRGGAASGVGREEKAARMKRK